MEVADAGRAAYATTLTQHHNFAVRQVFKVRHLAPRNPPAETRRVPVLMWATHRPRWKALTSARHPCWRAAQVAMSAAPYRADFFAKMGGPEEETVPKLAAFTPMFSASLVSLEEYFLAQGLEQPAK